MKLRQAVLAFLLGFITSSISATPNKLNFWNTPKHGANFFNQYPTLAWWHAAKNAHIQFVRIAPNRWKSRYHDFLLGNTDHYKGVIKQDLHLLDRQVNYAHEVGIKVVLTTLSLPCSRWKQQNHFKDDLGLWKNKTCWQQSANFWKTIAAHYKRKPTVVGYDLLNEPHPEVIDGHTDFTKIDFKQWYAAKKGTAQDLNLFNQFMDKAIRKVDPNTPIILESGLYDTPWAYKYLAPLKDKRILYSIHMYEPYIYTTKRINKGRYTYPGKIPMSNEFTYWNKKTLRRFFKPIIEWQTINKIPNNRMIIAEFGVNRQVSGARQYLSDLISIFNQHNWHWSFYTFRPDSWTGMDYELGTKPLGQRYWKEIAIGKHPALNRNDNNPLFKPIKLGLAHKLQTR